MNAKELLDALEHAKLNLWKYLSSEETTYLPLDVFDLRDSWWTGKPTTEHLKWGWDKSDGTWEYESVDEVVTVIVRDGLTFVWYKQEGELHWAVFDNDMVLF